jgi:hypothetical protein
MWTVLEAADITDDGLFRYPLAPHTVTSCLEIFTEPLSDIGTDIRNPDLVDLGLV